MEGPWGSGGVPLGTLVGEAGIVRLYGVRRGAPPAKRRIGSATICRAPEEASHDVPLGHLGNLPNRISFLRFMADGNVLFTRIHPQVSNRSM